MSQIGILLAAGASRRFGAANKLLAPLKGRPLVTHAADALRATGLDHLIVVVRSEEVADQMPGFDPVIPDAADPTQSDSLRAGIARAEAMGAQRAVIVLGDMPFVTADIIAKVIAHCTHNTPAAATDGTRPIPPVCFPGTFFDRLARLEGDRGAALLLSDARLLQAEPRALWDVDTPDALAAAEASCTRHIP